MSVSVSPTYGSAATRVMMWQSQKTGQDTFILVRGTPHVSGSLRSVVSFGLCQEGNRFLFTDVLTEANVIFFFFFKEGLGFIRTWDRRTDSCSNGCWLDGPALTGLLSDSKHEIAGKALWL